MADTEFNLALRPSKEASFGDTNWWVVHKAGQPELPQADAARAQLCRRYWYPVYCYIRRLGQGHEDAQDLTQEFFARLLEKNYLQRAASEKGKFRSYLLMMLKRFLADEWDRARRQKRGGGKRVLSLNEGDTKFRARLEPADELSPDKLFDRLWAESLLQHALERLEQQCAAAGKDKLFRELKPFVVCDTELTYGATAERLNLTVSNLKVTVHRLRQQYRELLRAEIAKTASTPAEIEQELSDLHAALR